MSTTPDILQRKLVKDFDSIDFDGNGVLGRDDMQKFADNICREFGQSANSEKYRIFQEGCMQWWDKLLGVVDKNGDQQISREEYVAAYRNASESQIQDMLDPYVHGLYTLIDTDGDQRISKSEFVRLERAAGVPEATSDQIFDRLDEDGSGYLSKNEFGKYIQQFYGSVNADMPGNFLLGKV